MTNEAIIENIAVSLYGEEEVSKMKAKGIPIPLHTARGWKSLGPYKIKKGEHGIRTRLWKMKPSSEPEKPVEFYMATAFLFSRDQVEMFDESNLTTGSYAGD